MDTDGGQLDKDPVYDRAVGPMQFIPSTWSSVKVDADGDGKRNPQDIDDASLASAVYLCSGSDDLASRSGQESAVFRYNHSRDYVDLVLRIMEAYSQGDYTAIPSGTYGGTVFSPSYSSAIKSRHHKAKATKHQATRPSTPASSGGTSTSSGSGARRATTAAATAPPARAAVAARSATRSPQATQNLTQGLADVTQTVTQPVVKTLSSLEAKALCTDALGPVAKLIGPVTTKIVGSCATKIEGKTQAEADSSVVGILNNLLKKLLGPLAPQL